MTYYVGNMPVGDDELMHYGTKGMRWGQRRFQNRDGSLTAAGRLRYGWGKARKWGSRQYKNTKRGVNKVYRSGKRWANANPKRSRLVKAAKVAGAVAGTAGLAYLAGRTRTGRSLRYLAKTSRAGNTLRSLGYLARTSKAGRIAGEGATRIKNTAKSLGYLARTSRPANYARSVAYLGGDAAKKAAAKGKRTYYKAKAAVRYSPVGRKAAVTLNKAKTAKANIKVNTRHAVNNLKKRIPTSATVTVNGRPYTIRRKHVARAAGIGGAYGGYRYYKRRKNSRKQR